MKTKLIRDRRAGGHTITGTNANDTIFGRGGPDRLLGLGGNDLLDGGVGNDSLFGGAGNDRLRGVNGSDTLNGNDGVSYIYIIFDEGTDIYWARSRTLEYLNSVTQRLPKGVKWFFPENVRAYW